MAIMDNKIELFSSLRYDPLLTTLSSNSGVGLSDGKNPSPFYMLPFHRDRILQAAEHFHYDDAANKLRGSQGLDFIIRKLTETIDTDSSTPLRVRILVGSDGVVQIESNPVPVVAKEQLYPSRLPPPKDAVELKVSPLTGGAMTMGDNDSVSGDPHTDHPWDVIPDPSLTPPTSYTSYKTTSRDMYNSARERVGIQDMAEKREVLLVAGQEGEIMEGSLTSPYFWRNGKWTTPPVSSGGQIGTTRRWALDQGLCVEGVVKVDSLVDGEMCWFSNGVRGFQVGKIKLP